MFDSLIVSVMTLLVAPTDVETLRPGAYNLIKVRVPGGQVMGITMSRDGEGGEDGAIELHLEDITQPRAGSMFSQGWAMLDEFGGGWLDINLAFGTPRLTAWNSPTVVSDLTTSGTNPGDAGYGVPDGEVNGADLSFFVENWREAQVPPDSITIITR